MRLRSLRWPEAFALSATVILIVVILFATVILMPVSSDEHWQEVFIPEGASFTQGLRVLQEHGIIKSRFPFLVMGRITGWDRNLKAGYYFLSPSMSPLEIFKDLIDGRTIQYTITIPEGSDLEDIKRRLFSTGLFDEESWKLTTDPEFLDSLDIDAPSLEGYLYPDTYNFPKGTDPRTIFRIMVQRMREYFNDELRERAAELGMTENEVLTLASIIEKEVIYDSERPLISAVFHNRLKKNMRLQADPTVLYGIDEKDRWIRIRYRDLKRKTPYNTYVIKGLPPGPIASPGIKSIRAALYPADVDYLYFVAKNNGRHHFSRTNKEHWEAVINYQLNGRDKRRKSEEKADKKDKAGKS
jgi:UPF0755 protein